MLHDFLAHGLYLLLVTFSAVSTLAQHSGNSGGPVLQGDQVVGLAFQSLVHAENTGYVIPTPVVHHFLQDLERNIGKYTGT